MNKKKDEKQRNIKRRWTNGESENNTGKKIKKRKRRRV